MANFEVWQQWLGLSSQAMSVKISKNLLRIVAEKESLLEEWAHTVTNFETKHSIC